MALSADTRRNILGSTDPLNVIQLPVAASTKLWEGAFCENNSGYARKCTASSTNGFCGMALRQADNTSGSAGDISVTLLVKGLLRSAAVTGVTAVTDLAAAVYASDDGTLTLTSTNNIQVGKIARFVSTGVADVLIEAVAQRSV